MSEPDPFHGDLIRALGGNAKVASALSIDRVVLGKWRERGIPSKYWHHIIELAASLEEPIEVSAAELERRKPVSQVAA